MQLTSTSEQYQDSLMFENGGYDSDMVVPELECVKVEPIADVGIFSQSLAAIYTATDATAKKSAPFVSVSGFSTMLASTSTQQASQAAINYKKQHQHQQPQGSRSKGTGLSELDGLGLLDGLISPRSASFHGSSSAAALSHPSSSVITPPAFTGALAFFGAQQPSSQGHAAVDGGFDSIAEVPEHIASAPLATRSCSAATPSESPFGSEAGSHPTSPSHDAADFEMAHAAGEEHGRSADARQQHPLVLPAGGGAANSTQSPRRRSSRAQHPSKRFGGGTDEVDKWFKEDQYVHERERSSCRPSSRLVAGPTSRTHRAGKLSSTARKSTTITTLAPLEPVVTPSLGALDASGALPADHKPARGRGRQLQLAKMTPAQKKAETRARLEKNRQAARGFRVRRKDHVQDLELAITDFESRDRKQQRDIADLQRQIAKMQAALGNR